WVRGGRTDGSISYWRLSLLILIFLAVVSSLVFLVRKMLRQGFWRIFRRRQVEGKPASVVEFYERMTKALAVRGLERAAGETPLEFAEATGIPEALKITRAYNRVRFGVRPLTGDEAAEVERSLTRLEGAELERKDS
ncbi:MAG TPA: DUF4129 domain-containing protein, partial [Pyrinomonadaceae bacterium]|nr:DUF4129 domain-containing protein [Pyrinomonadaceae bacterium]